MNNAALGKIKKNHVKYKNDCKHKFRSKIERIVHQENIMIDLGA